MSDVDRLPTGPDKQGPFLSPETDRGKQETPPERNKTIHSPDCGLGLERVSLPGRN